MMTLQSRETWVPPAPVRRAKPAGYIAAALSLRSNPLTIWSQVHFEEPVVVSRGILGHLTIVSHPAGIRHVLLDNIQNYPKDAMTHRVLDPALGNGLLMAEGGSWKAQRRMLAPLFAPKAVDRFLQIMIDTADELTQRWQDLPSGHSMDVVHEITSTALKILQRTIFSTSFDEDSAAITAAINEYFKSIGVVDPLDMIGAPAWIPRMRHFKTKRQLDFFNELVSRLIAERREVLGRHPDETPSDILGLLLTATDPESGAVLPEDELRANITTFVGAGHETTVNLLCWALFIISQAPDVRERLETEIDSVVGHAKLATAHFSQLVYVRAVLEETLRLYPPSPYLSREAIADDEICGARVPAGSVVGIAPWIIQRHRRLWEEPDQFIPERFVPGRRESINRFAYIPFGAGPRICIGASFAMQEATIVLASILQRFRLDLAEGQVVRPIHRVTLRFDGGLRMTKRNRRGVL
jgi:cytochrome P450